MFVLERKRVKKQTSRFRLLKQHSKAHSKSFHCAHPTQIQRTEEQLFAATMRRRDTKSHNHSMNHTDPLYRKCKMMQGTRRTLKPSSSSRAFSFDLEPSSCQCADLILSSSSCLDVAKVEKLKARPRADRRARDCSFLSAEFIVFFERAITPRESEPVHPSTLPPSWNIWRPKYWNWPVTPLATTKNLVSSRDICSWPSATTKS